MLLPRKVLNKLLRRCTLETTMCRFPREQFGMLLLDPNLCLPFRVFHLLVPLPGHRHVVLIGGIRKTMGRIKYPRPNMHSHFIKTRFHTFRGRVDCHTACQNNGHILSGFTDVSMPSKIKQSDGVLGSYHRPCQGSHKHQVIQGSFTCDWSQQRVVLILSSVIALRQKCLLEVYR